MIRLSHPAHIQRDPAAPDAGAWHAPRARGIAGVPMPLVFLALAAIAIFTVDEPIAQLQLNDRLPNFGRDFFARVETFGHGIGVLIILIGVWCVDPKRRRMVPRLVVASFGSGLAANVVKLVVGRTRPFHWLGQAADELPSQFVGWLPMGLNGSAHQSFPSAHTATAVGLALGLGAMYPQAARFFGTLAALVAVQRVVVGAHYVSDILAGTATAWLVVISLFELPALARRFDRFERLTAAGIPMSPNVPLVEPSAGRLG